MKHSLILVLFGFLIFSCSSGKDNIVKYMNDGLTKVAKSDNKGAIEDFSKVIELDQSNSEAYYNRACCYYNLKDTAKSMADYNKAIELDPDYADAYFNRALLKDYLNDREGACADWEKAVKLGKANIKDSFTYCR